MVYSYYRCAKGLSDELSLAEKIAVCLFLCGTENRHALSFVDENLRDSVSLSIEVKAQLLAEKSISFRHENIFPFDIDFSEGISNDEWIMSLLQQPGLFIRLRKDQGKTKAILKEHNIPFDEINNDCLSLPNGAAIDKILPPDTYVVQDLSSQTTGTYFHPQKGERWYDCCSGAGGKSLLLKDIEPNVQLTVSDKRDTILHNLKERFKLYGHKLPEAIVADVSNAAQIQEKLGSRQFDNIICDVPCSGSGTWARTPEQAYFFDAEKVTQFHQLQTSIAVNAAKYLKARSNLFYITCSVFAAENEKVVTEIANSTGLQIKSMQLINGISKHADCMFISILEK